MSGNSATIRVPSWIRRLDRLPVEVTQRALSESREFLRDEVRRNASKGGDRGLRVRSGALLRSIRTYLKPRGEGGQLSLGMKFYGWVNNRGAVIVPKKAPRLRFFIPGVGWRTSMRVVIPARPFADDALAATRAKYPSFLRQAIRQAAR